jgi:hypothetical protein
MKYLLITIFISISISFSCSDLKNKSEKQTEIFTDYLKENFNENISNELQYYFLISNYRCVGCVEKNLLELTEFINAGNSNHFTFITSDMNVFPDSLRTKVKILLDKNNKFDYLNLDIANLTLIETFGGEITFIKCFNPEDSPVPTFIKTLE